MRIISGKFKGRKLAEFNKIGVRPTSDMLRESLFNIIGEDIEGSSFLDLYSGTGAIGIEALSRGAKRVVLNDNSRESISLITKNVKMLGIERDCVINNAEALGYLDRTSEKFDYIFIDPPYANNLGAQSIEKSINALGDKGIIIFEDEKDVDYDFEELALYDKRRYGRAFLYFFKRKFPACVFAGTFDPLTKGHVHLIERCLKLYKKVVLVLGENSQKNPEFCEDVRYEFLTSTFGKNSRIDIVRYSLDREGFFDLLKSKGVIHYVRGIRDEADRFYEDNYKTQNLEIYPGILTVFIKAEKQDKKISSTLVREYLKEGRKIKGLVPEQVENIITRLQK